MTSRDPLLEVPLNAVGAHVERNKSAKGIGEKQVHSKLKLSDFELVKKIGQGGFGAVYVCRKRDTKEVLALKVVNKSLIWKKNKVTQMKNERDVLASHLTSWMVQLAYSFQDRNHCYLAMEYCPGGDLRHLLSALGYLEEQEARLYMAEMILAVFSLHSLGYIHRDLKPDNFLIDSNGHLKLTDFGLSKDGLNSNVAHRRFGASMAQTSSLPDLFPSAKRSASATPQHTHVRSRTNAPLGSSVAPTPLFEGRNREENQNGETARDPSTVAYSVVGSPHYMSPEVLSETNGYGAEVDWWSLGCIFWELVTGSPPFVGETPQAVFEAILDWKQTLPLSVEEYKDSLTPECLDFILQFLCESKERFGVKRVSLSKLFAHPFFKDFPVERIFEMEPPFVPQLSDECDTSYFDSDEARPICDEDLVRESATAGDAGSVIGTRPLILFGDEDLNETISPSGRMTSVALQCPQTAPRRLTRHVRHFGGSQDDDLLNGEIQVSHSQNSANGGGCSMIHEASQVRASDFHPANSRNAVPSNNSATHLLSPLAKPTGRYTAVHHTQSRSRWQQHYYHPQTSTAQRAGAGAGSFTPLRRLPHSPSRDIAGFTFQRKNPVKPSSRSVSAIIRLDFDSDIPLQYLQRSSSPASDSSSTSSPSDLGAHFDLSLLDLTPKALIFGEERNE
jgi:serine/threonine protein kinase